MKILGIDTGLKWISITEANGTKKLITFRKGLIKGIHSIEIMEKTGRYTYTPVDEKATASPGIVTAITELAHALWHKLEVFFRYI